MKTVEKKHIKEIIELSEEGMGDTVGLDGSNSSVPYDFFVKHFAKNSGFKYDLKMDNGGMRGSWFEVEFGHHTDWEDEWETFWAALFNSTEDLNNRFWEHLKLWLSRRTP